MSPISKGQVTMAEAFEILDRPPNDKWRQFQVDYPATESPSGRFAIEVYDIPREDPHRKRTILNEGIDRDCGWGTFRRLIEKVEGCPLHPQVPGSIRGFECPHEPEHEHPNGRILWMSDTRAEIMEHAPLFNKLTHSDYVKHKTLLINGLGLGVVVHAVLTYDGIDHIDVVEKDPEIIELIRPFLPEDKVTIHNASAYDIEWPAKQRWTYAWHDIWPFISDDNLPEMDMLKNKYRGKVQWQDSWQRKGCQKMKKIYDALENETLDPAVALEILGGKWHI